MSQWSTFVSEPTVGSGALAQPFLCRWRDAGLSAARVKFGGELDVATAPLLAEALRDAQHDALVVRLDLRDVTFMDSAGVHAIVDATAAARHEGRRLLLVGVSCPVERVFGLTAVLDDVGVCALDTAPAPGPGGSLSTGQSSRESPAPS